MMADLTPVEIETLKLAADGPLSVGLYRPQHLRVLDDLVARGLLKHVNKIASRYYELTEAGRNAVEAAG